jgi:uncharacterized protein YcbK (DUF882 family)
LPRQRSRNATAEWRILLVAIVSAFVAACSATTDPTFQTSNLSLAPGDAPSTSVDLAQSAESADDLSMPSDGTTTLPGTVAYVPALKSGTALTALQEQAEAAVTDQDSMAQAAQAAASDAQAQSAAAASPAGAMPLTKGQSPDAQAAAVPAPDHPVYVTATEPQQAAPPPPKKRSLFASLFGSTPAAATPLVAPEPKPTPIITLASASPDSTPKATKASLSGGVLNELDDLPGVRKSALFEIKRKSGIDDDSDVDLHEDEDTGSYQVASAAGLARLAPNGLLTQTENVDVACLKPSLVRVLKTVERHYARKVVVTSGYRSPAHNRRARGAKNSLHMYCAAADIQVPGVGKWELASYFRTMAGRGGVGTYCHTESVHIDVGPERDWNWRCRRRR